MEEQSDSDSPFPDIYWEDITIPSRSIQKALDLISTWSDLDWDAFEQELHRIHHEPGKPVT